MSTNIDKIKAFIDIRNCVLLGTIYKLLKKILNCMLTFESSAKKELLTRSGSCIEFFESTRIFRSHLTRRVRVKS